MNLSANALVDRLLGLSKPKVKALLSAYYINNPPKNAEELHHCIEVLFGYSIPNVAVCPGHSAPFSFLVDGFFEAYPNILVLANRTGGKTLSVAILNALEAIFKSGCEIASLAGSKEQASKQYEYARNAFSNNEMLWSKFIISSLQSKTTLKNKSSFKIFATSSTSVRSPHLPKLRIDEIDEIEDREIFNGALSIPLTQNGIKANTIMTSTRHKPFGLMKEMVETSSEKRRRLIQYCYKEVSQRCPDYLSGDVPTTYYINSREKGIILPKKFIELPDVLKSNYSSFNMFNKCGKCELAPSCRGDLKRSNGYYLIDDLITKYVDMPSKVWEAEWECKLPSMGDLVYGGFEEATHVKNIEYNKDLKTYCGIDFGWKNFRAVWFQIGLDDEILIFDEYIDPCVISEHRAAVMRSKGYYNVQYWGDPAGASVADEVSGLTPVQELRKCGVNVNSRRVKPDHRRNFIRKKMNIRNDGAGARTWFYIDKEKCPITYKSFLSYHLHEDRWGSITDEPVKDDSEHSCHATEYGVVGAFNVGASYWK